MKKEYKRGQERQKTVLIEARIRGVIQRSSIPIATQSSYRASRACTWIERKEKKTEKLHLTGYERLGEHDPGAIATRLLELPQRQLISKPTKSDGEPVLGDDNDGTAVTPRRKQSRMMIGPFLHLTVHDSARFFFRYDFSGHYQWRKRCA